MNLFSYSKAKPTPEWKPPNADEIFNQSSRCASSNAHLPVNEQLKCSRKCALENLGFFNETNGFNVENIVKNEMEFGFSESVARSIAEKCAVKKEGSESNCEWADRGLSCLKAADNSKRN